MCDHHWQLQLLVYEDGCPEQWQRGNGLAPNVKVESRQSESSGYKLVTDLYLDTGCE